MRATFYARVSSETDQQLNSLDNQISYYEELIKRNKAWTFVEGYIDKIYVKSIDEDSANLTVKIFTGRTEDKYLRKLEKCATTINGGEVLPVGHMVNKMMPEELDDAIKCWKEHGDTSVEQLYHHLFLTVVLANALELFHKVMRCECIPIECEIKVRVVA